MISLAVAITLAITVAACGDDAGALPPPAPPPPDTPSTSATDLDLTPAEQQAADAARAKFDEFMNAYIEVSTAPLPTAETAEALFSRVEQHADGALPQELRSEIVGRWGEGRVVDGGLRWDLLEVVDVDLEHDVAGVSFPTVFLAYCIDATDWLLVNADTGEPVGEPPGQRRWHYDLSWSDDWGGLGLEGWRVVTRTEMADRPC